MSWNLSEKEMKSVNMLPGNKRLPYFIKRVSDWEEVWSLKNEDGWVLSSTNDDRTAVPIWPHPAYAEACARNEWSDCKPAKIELSVWMERWIPGIAKDCRVVAVFPTPADMGIVLEAENLRAAISRECENY